MNWLDIVLIIFLIISAIGGFASGLIKSLLSLIGLIVGVVVAGRFYIALADHLTFISSQDTARIVAFIIIFLVIIIVATILGIILTKLVSAILLGWLNRLLGAVFGVFTGAIFIGALLSVWAKYSGGDTISGSAIASFLLDKFPIILGLLPKEFDTIKGFFQ
jgi:membrane protein required for colicin V production